MKIDRRSFLSLAIGGAAGTALTPIPWKLADDTAIWTQMWPWTPVPEDGEVSFADSTCSLCPGGCGITVRKVNNRAVKIEGKKEHPINNGGLCLLGLSGLQLLYNPTRVPAPLKRTGKRGENKWEKISWDQALTMVAETLKGIRDKGESHSVAGLSNSASGTVPQLVKRFLTAYGSPNFLTMPNIGDTYAATLKLMQGVDAVAGFDFEHADCIISFGSGLLDGWGSPVRMFRVNSQWRSSNAKLIQVESRLSKTAAKADRWVPIIPGTEAALAMGIAFVMIKNRLYNKDFVDQYTFGFEDWTDQEGNQHQGFKQFVLNEYSLERVESITGIQSSDIVSIGEAFAHASAPIAVCGTGQGGVPGNLDTFLAVHALNALVGNINRKGGIWTVPQPGYIQWPEVEADMIAGSGIQKPRLDDAQRPSYPFSGSDPHRFFQNILSEKGYPVQALFIMDANPCYSMPDVDTIRKAFEKIPFIVSFSPYMDETAQQADLILPNHTYLERWEDVPVCAGMTTPMVGLSRPVVSPQLNTRHTGDVILAIAKKMGGGISAAFPWNNYESCLKSTLRDQWRSLMREGVSVETTYTPSPWESAFQTPSNKFEFFVTAVQQVSAKDPIAMPHFEPEKVEGDEAAYPLMLVAYDSMRLANGFICDPPFVVKTVSDTVLKGNDSLIEINPETAKAYRLDDGKYAILKTPKGSAKVKIYYSHGIMPGVIALPRGLGHTAYDKFIAGKGVNVNAMIGPVDNALSGYYAPWGSRAKLEKA